MPGLSIIIETCDELFANRRPVQVAREWLSARGDQTMTWAFVEGKIAPLPLDPGAHELANMVRDFTDCCHTLAETVAHLFDHAEGSRHALWCWREGEREYVRIEPRPEWAAA